MGSKLERKPGSGVFSDEEEVHRRVEGILDGVPDAVLLVDADGRIVHVNRQAKALFGYEPEELVGEPVEVLVPDDVRRGHAAHRMAYAADPQVRPMGAALEIRGRRKNGALFDADIQLSPLSVDDRSLVVASVRDVTESRRTQRILSKLGESLERANAELRSRNVELEQFTFAASHDLQEPLRKIIAFGDRLGSRYADVLDERALDYLARMRGAAGRMQLLIGDLLRWSRLATRAQPFEPVDLSQVVADVLEDLVIAIEKSGATVEVGPLPTIEADAPQMGQLFQNLFENAIKYREPDRPCRVEVEADPPDDGRVRIRVRDNGIGFDQKYADKVFEVFERLHGRGDHEGTGIGLALCRKIVERHRGTIDVESELGVGTTFTIVLPVHPEGTP